MVIVKFSIISYSLNIYANSSQNIYISHAFFVLHRNNPVYGPPLRHKHTRIGIVHVVENVALDMFPKMLAFISLGIFAYYGKR